MSKTLDELKAKRERYAEWLEQQDVALRKLRSTFLDDERIIEGIIADYKSEISDLDRAIAALSVPEVAEVDGLAEVEIPEGFTKWEGGDCPVAPGTLVKVIHRDGDVLYSVAGDDYAADWTHCDGSGDIIAYRVLPIEPAEYEDPTAVAIAAHIEAEQADYPDLTDEQDAAIESATAEYQSTDGAEIVSGEPWSIASSSQHAEESARAQSLPPLFKPEPPQAATPEELEAMGVTDPGASAMARMLLKERA